MCELDASGRAADHSGRVHREQLVVVFVVGQLQARLEAEQARAERAQQCDGQDVQDLIRRVPVHGWSFAGDFRLECAQKSLQIGATRNVGTEKAQTVLVSNNVAALALPHPT